MSQLSLFGLPESAEAQTASAKDGRLPTDKNNTTRSTREASAQGSLPAIPDEPQNAAGLPELEEVQKGEKDQEDTKTLLPGAVFPEGSANTPGLELSHELTAADELNQGGIPDVPVGSMEAAFAVIPGIEIAPVPGSSPDQVQADTVELREEMRTVFTTAPAEGKNDSGTAKTTGKEVIFDDGRIAVRLKKQVPVAAIVPDEKPREQKIPQKRGRKSFREIDAEVDLIEVPDDEELFKKHYYPISQVAKWFRVNTSLLRFWENEFDILKPKKNRKGDRLFRPEDVKNIHLIYQLLRQRKYTVEGAKEYLKVNKKKADTELQLTQTLLKFKRFLLELKAGS